MARTMKPVGDAELAQARADMAAAVCDQDATIKRNTAPTKDGYGTGTPGLTTVTTTKGGLAEPNAGQLQAYGDRLGSLATWIVRFPWGTDVRAADTVEIGGKSLQVARDLTPSSYALLTSVLASEV